MIIIFDHSTYWNIKSQMIQHTKCNIDLSFSSIHHQNIRKFCKTAKCSVFSLFFQFF